jgi:hypothetical protein
MDVGQAKTRFFKRNSEKADQLTIHPHKEDEFWLWVNSWAAFIQRPSDLGFSDEGYDLPPIEVRWHEVPSDHKRKAGEDAFGQGRLLKADAIGIVDASREKRESLGVRIEKMKALLAEDDGHCLLWHDLEDERRAIEAAVPGAVSGLRAQPLDEREAAIIRFSDGEIRYLAAKPVLAGRVQFPAPLQPRDLPRHRVQVQRLHPGDPPHPAIPADEAGRDRADLFGGRAQRPRGARRQVEAPRRDVRAHVGDHPHLRPRPQGRRHGRAIARGRVGAQGRARPRLDGRRNDTIIETARCRATASG